MSKQSYYEKLKDPRWQKKRLEVLEYFGFACRICDDDTSTLHVHHNNYISGREPWEYLEDQFTVLCDECHNDVHKEEDPITLMASLISPYGLPDRYAVAYLIAGFCGIGKDNAISLLGHAGSFNEASYDAGVISEKFAIKEAMNCK